MAFKRFEWQLFLRLGVLFSSMLGLAFLITNTGFGTGPVLVGILVIAIAWEIVRFIQRSQADLTRFFQAVRNGDFSQRFSSDGMGRDFEELGQTMNALIKRFHDSRADQEKKLHYVQAVVDHVPVPLLSLGPQGTLKLLNNAARRFFAPHALTRIEDLDRFGADLRKTVTHIRIGDRQLVRLKGDGTALRVAVSATEIAIGGAPTRLIALQNISNELETTELEAWQQLVQVLTHEVMNSITPVTSLAETAAHLLNDGKGDSETLQDVKHAVDTVARRAKALTHFVESYRKLSRLPRPKPQRLALIDLFKRLELLMGAEWRDRAVTMHIDVSPPGLAVNADPEQLEQVLINLAQNAAEALEGREDAKIWLTGSLNRQGHVVINVADNGPGIPADIRERVFIPFFTTKRTGSGVGLALTRQVMIAHKGSVSINDRKGGGTVFTLSF